MVKIVGTFPEAWEETCLVSIAKYDATTPIVKEFSAVTEEIEMGEPDYPGEGVPNLAGGRIWKQSPQEDGELKLKLYPTKLDSTTPSVGAPVISAIDGDTTTITVTTAVNHGLAVGDRVSVYGTTNYNGTFVVATQDGTTGFTIADTTHNFASEATGHVLLPPPGGMFEQFIGGTVDTSQPLATDTSWVASVDKTRDRFRVAIMWTDDVNVYSAEAATSGTDKTAIRFVVMKCKMVSHKTSYTDKVLVTEVTFKYPAMNRNGDTQMFRWESTNDTDTSPLPALVSYDDDDSWT